MMTNTVNINRPDAADGLETFARENCLMLLATKATAIAKQELLPTEHHVNKYACKTCGRTFKSFQALGGHRASHVRQPNCDASLKPKTFQCSTCGVEFATGQALGGHMRRHRSFIPVIPAASNTMSSGSGSGTTEEDTNGKRNVKNEIKKRKNDVVTPMLKKFSSGKRVCLELTLDYAPLVPKKEQEQELVDEIEEGEILEQDDKEDDNYDFLKLELRQPIRD